MKTYGSIKLIEFSETEHWWEIVCPPHVMIKLKGLFGKLNKASIGSVRVRCSPEICRDLEWFLIRYPMEMSSDDAASLEYGSLLHQKAQQDMEIILKPDYKPQEFKLALPPRQYQAVAAQLYLTRRSQLLADQLGLGKTVTAITTFTDQRTLPALVVCQAHLPKQWDAYIKKFLPSAKTHIIKTGTPHQMKTSLDEHKRKVRTRVEMALPAADVYITTYHRIAGWVDKLKGMVKSVVFDEVQELRHPGSNKYSAARVIRTSADYAMGLSGTPIYNYGGEIFNIIDMLSPNALGTEEEFQREWCSSRGEHAMLKDSKALGEYLRDTGLMVLRTRKEVGRELPPCQTIVEQIEYDESVMDDLDKVATELAHRLLKADTSWNEKGEAAREFDIRMRQSTGIAKAPFVAAFVKMLLDEGEKVVLTGWHRAVYDVWQKFLGSYNPVFYTGEESPAAKQRAVDKFVDGDAKLFIMSLRSGVGLDGLQKACSTIVHGELDWSPGVHEQCRGRLFRDGQDKPVMEYYLISNAGSDPIIADVLGVKKEQVTGILDPNASGLERLQSEAGRVKHMAEAYLKNKRK